MLRQVLISSSFSVQWSIPIYNSPSLISSKPCTFLLIFSTCILININIYPHFQFYNLRKYNWFYVCCSFIYVYLIHHDFFSLSLLGLFIFYCIRFTFSSSPRTEHLTYSTPLLIPPTFQIPNPNHSHPIISLILHRPTYISLPFQYIR